MIYAIAADFIKVLMIKNNFYDVNIVKICTLQVKNNIYSDRNGSSVILQFARLIVKNINVDLDIKLSAHDTFLE